MRDLRIRFGELSAVEEAIGSGTAAATGLVEKFGEVSGSGLGAAIVKIVRKLRGFLWMNCHTKRME